MSQGIFTLGDARWFSGLTSKNPPLGSMLNFDADVKKTTARHQRENPYSQSQGVPVAGTNQLMWSQCVCVCVCVCVSVSVSLCVCVCDQSQLHTGKVLRHVSSDRNTKRNNVTVRICLFITTTVSGICCSS